MFSSAGLLLLEIPEQSFEDYKDAKVGTFLHAPKGASRPCKCVEHLLVRDGGLNRLLSCFCLRCKYDGYLKNCISRQLAPSKFLAIL